MNDRVGQQLGNYRLLKLLGEGGFAAVFLGEHVYLKTTAAIKVLHAHLSDDSLGHFSQRRRRWRVWSIRISLACWTLASTGMFLFW